MVGAHVDMGPVMVEEGMGWLILFILFAYAVGMGIGMWIGHGRTATVAKPTPASLRPAETQDD